VEFFVLGRDDDDFDGFSPELNEQHWAYLDDYADRLTARGPTLSASGEHTGSVHVVRLDDLAAAEAFARAEPYWRAGLYRSLEVAPFRNLLGATMWQRERLEGAGASWLAVLRWAAPCAPPAELDATASALRADRSLVFCGLLLTPSAASASGLVAGFDATSPAVPATVTALAERIGGSRTQATVEPWRRGGRDQ
jgi:uncharacterized protein YciI